MVKRNGQKTFLKILRKNLLRELKNLKFRVSTSLRNHDTKNTKFFDKIDDKSNSASSVK